MFPISRSFESADAIEENATLLCRGHAGDGRTLSNLSHLRLNAGGEALQRPSRFLQRSPAELLEEWQGGGGWQPIVAR